MLPPSAPGMPAAVAAPSSPPPFTLFPALPLLLLCPVSVGSEKKKRKKHGQHCQRAAAATDVFPRPASCATFRPRVLSGRADLWLRGQRRALLPRYPPLPSALLTHGVLTLALSHSLSLAPHLPSPPLLSSPHLLSCRLNHLKLQLSSSSSSSPAKGDKLHLLASREAVWRNCLLISTLRKTV